MLEYGDDLFAFDHVQATMVKTAASVASGYAPPWGLREP